MEANKHSIFSILNSGPVQFLLPVYQRQYCWDTEQWKQFWDDIIKMIKQPNKKGHFIGSIVNIATKSAPMDVKKYILIDGQQRIATITLLAILLRNHARENTEETDLNAEKIRDELLTNNSYYKGNDRYKLLLTDNDRELLKTMIDDASKLPKESHSKLLAAYKFFEAKLLEGELTFQELYEAIGKLQVVNITLDDDDDAQEIFESINSTGRGLSQTDLIRNFVLMGLNSDEQIDVYENLWRPMELLFADDMEKMDDFFRDYLTMKQSKIPKKDEVYEDLKDYYNSNNCINTREFCEDIYSNAKNYANIIFVNGDNKKFVKLYQDINELKMVVSYPFLLKVHNDFNKGLISEEELIEIMKLCVSYVFRRSICALKSNSLNITFETLINKIKQDDYVKSFKMYLVSLDGSREFPNDERFLGAFVTRNIYGMDTRKFILCALENYDNKAPINPDNYTIEHIMPQNPKLSEEWRKELGNDWRDTRTHYLHTIGNLTLTAYNSELGDNTFTKKINMPGGYKESALKINASLVKLTHWNKNEIIRRAQELAGKAVKIWEYPNVVIQKINDTPSIYTIDDYDFNEQTQALFDEFDDKIRELSPNVERILRKVYIGYKLSKNFTEIVVQKKALNIYIDMDFEEITDPSDSCRDVSKIGHIGTGNVEIKVSKERDVDYAMEIIKQAFNKQIS